VVGKCRYVAVNRFQEFGEICRSGAKYFLKSVVGGAAPPPPREFQIYGPDLRYRADQPQQI